MFVVYMRINFNPSKDKLEFNGADCDCVSEYQYQLIP